jgi:PAS domain S-box-containing protein
MKPVLRILVVEDSDDDAILVLHHIKKSGYEINYVRVETYEEMNAALKEKTWDLVLSDYKMPHFCGLDALTLLKDSGIDLPFIVISGTIGEEIAVEMMKAGAHDYLMKNNLQRLVPAIERELRESKSRAERKEAEIQLLLSEQKFRSLAESSPDNIIRYDLECRAVYINRNMTLTVGRDVVSYIGKTPMESNDFPSTTDYQAKLQKTIQTGLPDELEVDVPDLQGEMHTHNIRFVAERNNESKIIGALAIGRDITEHKRTELEIVQMNRSLRILSGTNQALIHFKDENTLLNEVCRIVVEVGGYRMAWVGYIVHDKVCAITPKAHAGSDSGYIQSEIVACNNHGLTQSPIGIAIRTGQTYIMHNLSKNAAFIPWCNAALQQGYKSFIALPLKSEGQLLGILSIYSLEANSFDSMEVEILNELSSDLAFGINSLRIRARQKIAEEALREGEERFRLIAENTADTISVLDLNLNTTYISPSILKLRGYTVQESIKQSLDQILTPESLQKVKNLFAEQINLEASGNIDPNRTEMLELEEYCKDGSMIWVEISVTFIRDVNLKPIQILTVTRDITDRKRAEKNLRILSRAVEQSPVSIVITDTSGKIEYVNSKFTEITGFKTDEVLGQNPRILKSGEMSPEYYNQMWKTIASGKEWFGEFHNKKKDGTLFWELVSISPIYNSTGIITQFLAVKEDITDRKLTERELIKAKEKAEESDRLKTAFLCNMSHEIRTPMNAIIGFSEFLGDADLSNDKKQLFSNIIKDRSYDLLRIVEDILDISKIEVGQMQIIDLDVNIENIMNEIYEYYKLKMTLMESVKDITFNYVLDQNLKNAILRMDGQRLKQILNNFLDNAFKFTKAGSIEFGCKMSSTSELLFYIKDTGIGISEDKHEIIFDRFRQAEDLITTRSYGGTGLGLSIVKGLVSLMHGKIWLESQINNGTTFYFTIPLKWSGKTNEHGPIRNHHNYQTSSWKDKTILIVEDDKPNSEYIKLLISGKGLRILKAYNGEEALQIFKDNPNIDLVLMDIRLPDTNGLDVTKIIKKINPKIIVIAQTAYAFSSDIQECYDAGCSDYISKPINAQKLIILIDYYLKVNH